MCLKERQLNDYFQNVQLLRLCKDFSTEVNANEGVARLSIRRVYPEDEGEYTCVAYNELGSDSTSACLVVDGIQSSSSIFCVFYSFSFPCNFVNNKKKNDRADKNNERPVVQLLQSVRLLLFNI